MNIILNDQITHKDLLPLTFTRSAAELRVGISTIKEKWESLLKGDYSWKTEGYLRSKFPCRVSTDNLILNSSVCPNENLVGAINQLQKGQSLQSAGVILAQKQESSNGEFIEGLTLVPFEGDFNYIDKPWKIFSLNGLEIEADFDRITKGRKSNALNSTNTVIGERIFVEEGVEANCAVFNTTSGAIYLGKNSVVMEGTVIRGALALCEHSHLKLSTKIYGATTIGPHSKVGGEVNNSVITGYSNKGHDGFLGNAVIGEWCNLGADTNNSNLKNNYDEVKLWSYSKGGFVKTGLQFCGLIMGDHSKCGINTMFNTGTVVGVSANIFGAGFPRNFVPSFSWGGASGLVTYTIEKALKTSSLVMDRRGVVLDDIEKGILEHIYTSTSDFRQR